MYDVMSAGGANNGTLQRMVPNMLKGDLTGHQHVIRNARAEAEYFRDMVQAEGLNSTMSDSVYQGFNQAVNLSHGEKLLASLFEFQEQMSDLSVVPRQDARKAS